MPRLSLYKPERGQDYKFIDRQISEMFQVGGTDVYLHKYIGTESTDSNGNVISKDHTQIQDLIFLENRDRKYDQEIYRIRGLYNVQNIDFNLSQFGLFIDNDTLYMTIHINDFIKYIGRKPMSGDVLELPHLKDQFAFNDADIGLPRYYVIEDVGRASEGFSATWYPHLYRLKLKKITDSQQFADILTKPALNADGDPTGTTLKDLLSTYNKEIAINQAVIAEAELDADKSGYETRQFYTLAVDKQGKTVVQTVDETDIDVSNSSLNTLASNTEGIPTKTGYTGYLVGDGFPVNGAAFGFGVQFPDSAATNDFFLRSDFLPNRLFRFDGARWVKVEDAVRMSMTNDDNRQTLKTGFINNNTFIYNGSTQSDYVTLHAGDTVINTSLDFTTSPFVEFKRETIVFGFAGSVISDPANSQTDYPSIYSNNNGKLTITLPIINGTQQAIPYDGNWRVTLCTNREAQRNSLSKALRPKANFPEADF